MKLAYLLLMIIINVILAFKSSEKKHFVVADLADKPFQGNTYSSGGVIYEGSTPPPYGHGYSYGPWRKIQMKKKHK